MKINVTLWLNLFCGYNLTVRLIQQHTHVFALREFENRQWFWVRSYFSGQLRRLSRTDLFSFLGYMKAETGSNSVLIRGRTPRQYGLSLTKNIHVFWLWKFWTFKIQMFLVLNHSELTNRSTSKWTLSFGVSDCNQTHILGERCYSI